MAWYEVFIAFDTETTGLRSDAEVVELGIVTYYGGRRVKDWSSFFCPRLAKRDDPNVMKAMEINKINWDESLTGAPTFEGRRQDVECEMSEAIWVAHNAEFDIRMLQQEYKRLEVTPTHEPQLVVCTKVLDHALNPGKESYKLESVAQRWGVMQLGAHRAIADAETCGDIFARMMRIRHDVLPQDMTGMREFMKDAEKKWRTRPKGVW